MFVFLTRFTDLFSSFHYSVYHFVFKSLYIGITAAIVGILRFRAPFQSPYDAIVPYDRFPHWRYAVISCALITWISNWLRGYFFHRNQEFWGMLWTFSFILEAIAIVPQLFLLQLAGECDTVTGLYIFFKGAYGALNLLYYMLRVPPEVSHPYQWLITACAAVQTMVYVIFFGCIFRSNVSLRHKKDDSRSELSSELEAPLLTLELQPPLTS
jgi:ER lumen protein retaining receptor